MQGRRCVSHGWWCSRVLRVSLCRLHRQRAPSERHPVSGTKRACRRQLAAPPALILSRPGLPRPQAATTRRGAQLPAKVGEKSPR
eukprot:9360922-Prorocentrum_lima.AAC.1